MWKEQRQQKILDMISQNSSHTVGSLAKSFGLSEITIRKDIKELSDCGLIDRKYGSFSIVKEVKQQLTSSFENNYGQFTGTPVINRQQEDFEVKKQLVKAVFPKLLQVSSVFIDDSSTVLCLLPLLKELSGLTVITPSIVAINHLSFIPNIHTIGLGGTVCTIHKSFIGTTSIDQLQPLHIDLAIFGCYGISEEFGCIENFHSIVGIKKQASFQSQENVILMSGKKWTQSKGVPSLSWKDISMIITDTPPPSLLQKQMNNHNIEILIV